MAATKTEGGADLEQSFGGNVAAGNTLFQCFQISHQLGAIRQVYFPFRGQADAARGAIEQAHPQAAFNAGQALAD
ncbi:hypothetical protein D3C73_1593630 [compost metagenome]